MSIVIVDTFTEGGDTALGSHVPDTRPGSEVWAVDAGSVTVSGANDRAEVAGTGDHKAYINYSLDGDFEIEASFGGVSGNVSEDFVYPAINAYLTSDRGDLCGFYVDVFGGRYTLYYVSANDAETLDTYSFPSGVPASGTLKLTRVGDMLYGYVDGVQRCSLDVSGTTDFAGSPSVYPGLGWGTFTGGVNPWWDTFSVDDGAVGGGPTVENLTGAADIAFAASAEITMPSALTGAADIAFTTETTLTVIIRAFQSATMAFEGSMEYVVHVELAEAVDVTFYAAGAISGLGINPVVGSATMALTASADYRLPWALTGAAELALTSTGVIFLGNAAFLGEAIAFEVLASLDAPTLKVAKAAGVNLFFSANGSFEPLDRRVIYFTVAPADFRVVDFRD